MRTATKPYQRWRVAYSAVHFIGRLASLSKKVLQTTTSLALPRSISYTAIDVQPDVSVPPLNIDQQTLSSITRDKDIQLLRELGGVQDVALVLQTSIDNGITGGEADLLNRANAFGSNKYVKPPPKGLMSFVWEAANDMTLMILTGCAILSLVFGIKTHGLKEGWYDGGSIVIAVLLVIALSVFSNLKQSRQFTKLSSASSDICIQVVRDGRRQPISIFEVVVGDVVCLKIGDQIPADGLFLEGHSLKLDESSMTGESEHVEVNAGTNPFLISGTKVIDGHGFMLVTSVGMNTAWGEMMSSISNTLDEQTPLQARLNKLTSFIGKGGVAVAVIVLAVLMTRYFTGNTRDDMGNKEFRGSRTKATDVTDAVIRIISAAVTIIVVAIPEGLPLAVTLTLAFSMKRMMSDNAMVRKLSACETMGSATTICTDKTGTLTLNEMKVTEFWLGNEAIANNISSYIAPNVLQLLKEGVGLNTTGTVYTPNSTSPPEISGSSTEKAILSWGVFELGLKIDQVKQNCEIINVEAFNSEKKQSGVLMRRNGEEVVHVHRKGAAEMVLAMCSNYYVKCGSAESIDEEKRREFESIIKNMAAKSLRCIAFAHRRITEENEQIQENKLEDSELTLLGVVGLKDPCRPGVRETVQSCKNAGVNIKMITGDNVHTARAIAIECGILSFDNEFNGDEVVEGIQFRNYSPEERMAKVDSICVMARSSPFDKLLMVQCLKQKGHVVAVTGDGTNDAPALREADIGLSMGIQGTEVAKESSDIVILDDNFTSVVKVLRWGRCVYNNIQKFLQFQLTVNVAALVINLVAAVSTGEVPLSAVQLLWVNMIMDTLGALALATEQPSNDLMKKSPVGRSEPLITMVMWRNIIAQALYQVAVLLTLQFKGMSIFGVEEKVKNTLIFNSFVLCQIFNEFNARKLEKKNIFEGILKSRLFLGIVVVTIILQAIMVEFLKKFATTERLSWGQWGVCIGIAALSWPIGWLVKCIPVSNKQRANLSRASST